MKDNQDKKESTNGALGQIEHFFLLLEQALRKELLVKRNIKFITVLDHKSRGKIT